MPIEGTKPYSEDCPHFRPGTLFVRHRDRLCQRRIDEYGHASRPTPGRRNKELGCGVFPDGTLQLPDSSTANALPRTVLVLDEAWRLVESPFLVPLIREGRAFSLGVLIATQFPGDLPEEISGSTATKLFFSQTQLSQIREIQRTVVGKTSGSDADHLGGVLRGLDRDTR